MPVACWYRQVCHPSFRLIVKNASRVLQRGPLVYNPRVRPKRFSQIHRSALHEAGHVLAAVLLQRRILKATLHEDGTGEVRCDPKITLDVRGARRRAQSRENARREITIAWAGMIAEEVVTARVDRRGAQADSEMIVSLLRRLAPTYAHQVAIGRNRAEACRRLLRCRRRALNSIASALMEHGTLTGAQCRELVTHTPASA
jgi:ATP-dependent Zn protease